MNDYKNAFLNKAWSHQQTSSLLGWQQSLHKAPEPQNKMTRYKNWQLVSVPSLREQLHSPAPWRRITEPPFDARAAHRACWEEKWRTAKETARGHLEGVNLSESKTKSVLCVMHGSLIMITGSGCLGNDFGLDFLGLRILQIGRLTDRGWQNGWFPSLPEVKGRNVLKGGNQPPAKSVNRMMWEGDQLLSVYWERRLEIPSFVLFIISCT